ncbi:MAG: arginase [Clostridiales bacterium]|nr:arginase [Clostridiales bacterium]
MNMSKIQDADITIMNFSGIYRYEKFYKNENVIWLDFCSLKGKNCYCDGLAEKIIEEKIKNFPPQGLHFIDSGNYHYATKFWIDKIQEKFNLIVFDYHTDMQEPLFKNILSCGSWLAHCAEKNLYIDKIILLGVSRKQKISLDKKYKDKIICLDIGQIKEKNYSSLQKINMKYPIYISIDKDVLSRTIFETNWTQGEMKLTELKNILQEIMLERRIIGIDLCGECANEAGKSIALKRNDEVNANLLNFIKRQSRAKKNG